MNPEIVIGISGPLRGGKGSAVEILKILLGADLSVASTRIIIEEKLQAYGVENVHDRRAKQNGFLKIAEAEGDRWIHGHAQKIWESSRRPCWLFDAVLMEWDVSFVRSFPRWLQFHITAPMEIRWRRAVEAALREEPGSKPDEATMTLEDFQKLHEHPTAQFVDSIAKMPGVVVIQNTGSASDLGAYIVVALMNRRLVTSAEIERKREALQRFYASKNP